MDAIEKHPLCTKAGMALFGRFLAANELWGKATKVQRRLIEDAVRPMRQKMQQEMNVLPQPKTITLGPCPVIEAPPRTLASMRSKGLADEDGRLTVEAVDAFLPMGD